MFYLFIYFFLIHILEIHVLGKNKKAGEPTKRKAVVCLEPGATSHYGLVKKIPRLNEQGYGTHHSYRSALSPFYMYFMYYIGAFGITWKWAFPHW